MAPNIVCNFKKCRKALQFEGWITSCSHAFCMEHGEQEFANSTRDIVCCPACDTQLGDKFDVVQADLNPPEGFKSIVLAGMKPDIVMDIAMRAISFWSYQMEEETKYHENMGRYTKEKIKNLEDSHNLMMQKFKTEMLNSKNKMEVLRLELEKHKRQSEECANKLEEKNRKIQKLQYQVESLKRNSCHINDIDDDEPRRKQNLTNILMNRYKKSDADFDFQPGCSKTPEKTDMFDYHIPNSQDSFTFNPVINKN